jgi:hypothetical protein
MCRGIPFQQYAIDLWEDKHNKVLESCTVNNILVVGLVVMQE